MTVDPLIDATVLDLEGLHQVATAVVAGAPRGSVVWLSGELGSGKTAFVREAVRAAGARDASSPTYAFVHEYNAKDGPIFHVDCYRLEEPAEAVDLDFPEMQRIGVMLFVEWPERAGDFAPPPNIHLKFSHVGDADRRLVERVE